MNGNKFLSGSARHFFDYDGISDSTFEAFKSSVGDIDTQVDVNHQLDLNKFLGMIEGQKVGWWTLIGHKLSGDQTISLWKFDDGMIQINVQVDFEFVDFENGIPTEWSEFSHSSSWEDIKLGVKGVAHKFILRALSAPMLRQCHIPAATSRSSAKVILSAPYAFSPQGLRKKLEPIIEENGYHKIVDGLPAYRLLSTKETPFNRDISQIMAHFFPGADQSLVNEMWSFTGVLRLIKKYHSPEVIQEIADGFVHTLWGQGAQKLYRGNDYYDNNEKLRMVEVLTDILRIPYSPKWTKQKEIFYSK